MAMTEQKVFTAHSKDVTMAKKSKKNTNRPLSNSPAEKNISVSKQAVGGVTGAVSGAVVGGPAGAIAAEYRQLI
jgi:hypothetical protein